ncbi:hypothetical protein BCR37DRAFT_143408 [Protomyces lactucae-debilis]|uniref:Secreted protein n=1 Tax=Protomyces lactucae-debilis TaxID=2754530 RepID=A0A1Y2FSW6_PROLT|nr:uncharacterized protein BCR37DRAFT_143408 [Protomyces lactucae-debilis]ORY87090.1 hypothetical protein BCR37DRAFT_143408 [Protomyces lactucae-debilis]
MGALAALAMLRAAEARDCSILLVVSGLSSLQLQLSQLSQLLFSYTHFCTRQQSSADHVSPLKHPRMERSRPRHPLLPARPSATHPVLIARRSCGVCHTLWRTRLLPLRRGTAAEGTD